MTAFNSPFLGGTGLEAGTCVEAGWWAGDQNGHPRGISGHPLPPAWGVARGHRTLDGGGAAFASAFPGFRSGGTAAAGHGPGQWHVAGDAVDVMHFLYAPLTRPLMNPWQLCAAGTPEGGCKRSAQRWRLGARWAECWERAHGLRRLRRVGRPMPQKVLTEKRPCVSPGSPRRQSPAEGNSGM